MIVTRVKAEEAIGVLGWGGEALDALNEASFKAMYREAARKAHPDAPEGSAEAFARVDWAKHVLQAWIARQPTERPKGLAASDCPRCLGKGRMKRTRGFTTTLVKCDACNGTGDGGYEHDRSRE